MDTNTTTVYESIKINKAGLTANVVVVELAPDQYVGRVSFNGFALNPTNIVGDACDAVTGIQSTVFHTFTEAYAWAKFTAPARVSAKMLNARIIYEPVAQPAKPRDVTHLYRR